MTSPRARLCAPRTAATRLALAVLLLAALSPATALAAGTAPAAAAAQTSSATTELVTPSLDVEFWPEGDTGTTSIIAVAALPDSAKLPARVRIPLPVGAQLTWAGQIVGTDTSGDIAQQPAVASGIIGQYVELAATKSRTVQYEAGVTPVSVQGNKHTATLTWLQTTDASQVRFAVRLPLAATNVSIKPAWEGDPARNEQLGQMLYGLPAVNLKPGTTYTLTVDYELAPGAATTGTGASAGTSAGGAAPATAPGTPPWVFALLLVAVALVPLLFMVVRRRGAAAAAGDDDEDEDVDAGGSADDPDDAEVDKPATDDSDDELVDPDATEPGSR